MDVIFPVETIARELDFRLAAAVHFARKNRRVYIAHSGLSHRMVDVLRDGLYVGKHIFHPRPSKAGPLVYHAAKQRGFRVVHLSEEGAIYMGGVDMWRRVLGMQLDPKVLAPEDYVCTWGDFQRDFYRAGAPPCADRIVTTGHPRFDLSESPYVELYEQRAAAYRARYGRFLLVNTNFAAATHPVGLAALFSRSFGYKPEDPVTRRWFVGIWARTLRGVAHFVQLIHRLSIERPDTAIVVRPHPTDDADFFKAVFGAVPNVHVVREGTVTPWLRAATAVLHDGCTTALEAHLLGTPVVAFTPEPSEELSPYLPSLVGVTTQTADDAARAVWAAMDGALPDAAGARFGELAYSAFRNLSGPTFPGFLEVLEEAAAGPVRRSRGHMEVLGEMRREQAIDTARSLVSLFAPGRRNVVREMKGRFPGFDRAYVGAALAHLQKAIGRRVTATFHGEKLIEVESDAA